MNEPKIVATMHHADSINSGLDIVGRDTPDRFYAWRIGEVFFIMKHPEHAGDH